MFVLNCLSFSSVFSGFVDLALFYHPPNSSVSIFDTLLSTLCSHINLSLFSNFVLLGYFNVNVLNPQHPLFCKVQTLASSLCLSQVVSEPTRVTHDSCSTIDHVSCRLHLIWSVVPLFLHWVILTILVCLFSCLQVNLLIDPERHTLEKFGDIHLSILNLPVICWITLTGMMSLPTISTPLGKTGEQPLCRSWTYAFLTYFKNPRRIFHGLQNQLSKQLREGMPCFN